jgi:hypothetical protein
MKKPSSSLGIGLWVVGGLVAIYLAGAAFMYLDHRLGYPFYKLCPKPVQSAITFIYNPLFQPLYEAFPRLF